LCGIDLDTCRDLESGNLESWAEEVVARFASYAEVSPSGTGLKVFFRMCAADWEAVLAEICASSGADQQGKKWAHGTGEAHPPAIELFLGKRYFTVTGNRLPASPEGLKLVDADAVRWLIRQAGPALAQHEDDPARAPQDNSRSAVAFRKGFAFISNGANYEQMCEELRANEETAEWVREKGEAYGGCELKRIWNKVTKEAIADNRFRTVGKALCYMKWSFDGAEPIKLANFAARIAEDQVLDDGAVKTRRYRIEGTLADGTALPVATIEATGIGGSKWVNEHWGARAVVYPGAGTQMLEAAIKTVSGNVPSRKIFAHLGWRHEGGQWVYLHAGGAIGQDGPIDGIDVEIKGMLSHCVLPPIENIGTAVLASLEMIGLGPVGTVVAAATWRAPLGENTLSVHLAGMTGTFKSALAGVGQSHWGSYWNGVRFPANWADTANDIELKAFCAKDILFAVDEFLPRGHGHRHTEELYAKAERLFRGQANQSGRGRLDANIRERSVYWPRGFTMSSGEDIPSGHSLLARVVVVQVQKDSIDPEKLARLQDAGARGLLAQAMAGYVRFLAGKYDEIRSEVARRREELRREAIGAHRRTPRNYAELVLGCEVFLAFAVANGVITQERSADLLSKAKEDIKGVMDTQDAEQKAQNPVEVFLETLGDALAAGRVYVADWESKAEPPGFEEVCGWRRTSQCTPEGDENNYWRAQGDRLGWLAHGEKLYLISETAFSCVERLLGRPIGVSKNTLIRRLEEAGVITDHDKAKNTKLVSDEGNKVRVLAIDAKRVLLPIIKSPVGDRAEIAF
jgi:hypothetical protein